MLASLSAMVGLDFRILGSLEAARDGQPLGLGGQKQRTLLALLLLNASRVVTNDALVDALWGDSPPGKPLTAIQGYVSHLRKALDPERPFEVIVTEPAGYRLPLAPEELDLHRFELLLREGREVLATGDARRAQAAFADGLALFRGAPLADFTYEDWARLEIGRLEELRLACREERIEAELALGNHAEVVGELEALIAAHPLRERLRGQLMLALYRAGRQSEALAAYQDARRTLVDEFGIDPTPALQELERAVLRQDPALDLAAAAPAGPAAEAAAPVPERSILVVPGERDAEALVAVAEPLARSLAPHELIVSRLVEAGASATLSAVSAELNALREGLSERGVPARVAVFTSGSVPADLVRLASEQDVDLLLLGRGGDELSGAGLDDALREVLAGAPCDVGVCVVRPDSPPVADGAVLVPFGGSEHDWAALELGAWIASANQRRLRLLGLAGDHETGTRDASRLLASASLAVQQLVGVPTEPALLPPGEAGLVEESQSGGVLVAGLPSDWSERGLGSVRTELARSSGAPTLFVRRGVRPGGLAPKEGQTRFTWSLSEATVAR